MEKLTLWIKICSVVAVASAVTLALVPESKLKNAYRTICTLIVVFSLFSAVASIDINEFDFFGDEEEISYSLQEKSDELLREEGENFTNSFLEEKLRAADFDLRIESEFSDELSLEKVTVYGVLSEEEEAEVIRLINENAKEEITVIFAGDNDG